METCREVKSRAELAEVVGNSLKPYKLQVNPDQIELTPYGFDERVGWDTYLIRVHGYGVWGMAKGFIPEQVRESGAMSA